MNRNEAETLLSKYGQEQLLRFYDTLDDQGKTSLLAQIENLDFSLLDILANKADIEGCRGTFAPLGALTVDKIEANRESYEKTGLDALKACKVAAVLLAGGQGTRLGYDKPKGTFNIGLTHDLYIFECLFNNLMDVTKRIDTWIPLCIMTSDKNNDDTIAFLKEHNFFGYNPEYVFFFRQDMAPSVGYDGKILLEEPGKISLSPNGNGGWFTSLKTAGLDKKLAAMGVEWFTCFAVDNVLQRINDPAFIGAVIESGCVCGGKVVRKADPEERVGVLCLEDGRPSIVEYYEMTDDMIHLTDENGNLCYAFGVILNYMFRLDTLEQLVGTKIPIHVVEKKIPCLDAEGNPIAPTSPNGYKFELLVLDLIHLMDSCCAYEVVREKEFAPVKNLHGVDSVDTARELLKKNGVIL